MARQIAPGSFEAAAAALAEATASGELVRIVGAQTKQGWGTPGAAPNLELHTGRLDRILEHNSGDLTAVLEAGVPLARAQEKFAATGQMLALDPWLGHRGEATIGGILSTADAGPLRHRYGAPRDLVLGMTVALSDGTIARSGGKVIKNVAGYDLGKLACGAYGTLGLILSVSLRLQPLAPATATALGTTAVPQKLAAAAHVLAAEPLELEALDVSWAQGSGRLLACCGGTASESRAERVAQAMTSAGLEGAEVITADDELWADQRARQRSFTAALVRVAAPPGRLAGVIEAVSACEGSLVGRAALGTCFAQVDAQGVDRLREGLPEDAYAVLLDAPAELRDRLDRWGRLPDAATQELMRRIKTRFDPAGTCNRAIFAAGI